MENMQIPFRAYSGEQPYVFVSYSHANSNVVFPLIKQLHNKGYRIWYDEGIDPSTEWRKIIAKRLMPAKAVLFFISPEAVESKFVNREISFADEENIPIIPVFLKETELTGDLRLTLTLLQRIHYFRYPNDEAFFEELLRSPHLRNCFESHEKARTIKGTHPEKMQDAPAHQKTRSGNHAANTNVTPIMEYNLFTRVRKNLQNQIKQHVHKVVQQIADEISKKDYLVVNLKNWRHRHTNRKPNLDDDTCRTTEMWLRRIKPGTFMMGSPGGELGHCDNETQHQVTLTQPYYIGIFQVTQEQWERVMDTKPSMYKGITRPIESVSYDMIRGSKTIIIDRPIENVSCDMILGDGIDWPSTNGKVKTDSFIGRVRAKTGLAFDLPTEAQWEYACRAGTVTMLNSGKNLTVTQVCPNMAKVGRFADNRHDGKSLDSDYTKVGMYLPNAWGLYDMHGNVCEWCLDWFANIGPRAEMDPKGSASGSCRILRGGSYGSSASNCRSAYRNYGSPGSVNQYNGFRACVLPSLVQ